jgi:hypothetical protein
VRGLGSFGARGIYVTPDVRPLEPIRATMPETEPSMRYLFGMIWKKIVRFFWR